jgi:hypothetical protein
VRRSDSSVEFLRLAADLGGTYISFIVVVEPSPNPTTHSHYPITR